MNTDINMNTKNYYLNLIYNQLIFLYRKNKLNIINIPNIEFIQNLINTLPREQNNINSIYFICETIDKSHRITTTINT